LLEHADGADGVIQRDLLRRGDDDRARQRQELAEGEGGRRRCRGGDRR